MNPKRINKRLAALVLILGCHSALADGLVIRAGTCSAAAFTRGAETAQPIQGDHYLTGLSVNCTLQTHDKGQYLHYLQGIGGYSQYCVATINSLNRVGVKVTAAPVPGNDLHCLLDGKAKDMAKKLTRYP